MKSQDRLRLMKGTLPSALPFEYHPGKTNSAVLALHGYTGRPGDLKYLAEHLASAGIAVSVPRLPGAGTDLADLSRTTRRDWKRRSLDAWLDLRSRYEVISIIGYSMGGLLALDLARRFETERLVLLAPALITGHRIMSLTPLLAPLAGIMPEVKTGWTPNEDDDEETREHGSRYWTRRDLRSAGQLARLQGEVRRVLPEIKTLVFAIASIRDRSVPPEVIGLLDRRLPDGLSGSLIVENCGHDLPQGADRSLIARTVRAWLGV